MEKETKKPAVKPAEKPEGAGEGVGNGIVVFNAETLISQAIDKNVPIETMEKLLNMRRELKAEWAKEQFDKAMAEFQGECPVIKKNKSVANKDGRSVRYSYAPLDEIVSQAGKLISQHGLSYTITAEVKEGKTVKAIVKVTHTAGHNQDSSFEIPIDVGGFMTEPQKFASALTYAKRYAFCNAFGILTGDEDDDAQDTDQVKDDKPKKQFDTLMETVKKASLADLENYKAKMATSKKYAPEQKAEFLKVVEARIAELKAKPGK